MRAWTIGHFSARSSRMVGSFEVRRTRMERFANRLALCFASRFCCLAPWFFLAISSPPPILSTLHGHTSGPVP